MAKGICQRCQRLFETPRGRLPRLCSTCRHHWKWCDRCKQVKPLAAFPRHSGRPGHYCSDCQRDYERYGRPERPAARRAPACRRCSGDIVGRGYVNLCAACSGDWKWCNRCQETKPHDAFQLPNGSRIGYCYPCYLDRARQRYAKRQDVRDFHYQRHLMQKFGIAETEAARLADVTACEICGAQPPEGKRLEVDHDHMTDAVRGVLCRRCNVAVGWFEAEAHRLERLRAYLARYA